MSSLFSVLYRMCSYYLVQRCPVHLGLYMHKFLIISALYAKCPYYLLLYTGAAVSAVDGAARSEMALDAFRGVHVGQPSPVPRARTA